MIAIAYGVCVRGCECVTVPVVAAALYLLRALPAVHFRAQPQRLGRCALVVPSCCRWFLPWSRQICVEKETPQKKKAQKKNGLGSLFLPSSCSCCLLFCGRKMRDQKQFPGKRKVDKEQLRIWSNLPELCNLKPPLADLQRLDMSTMLTDRSRYSKFRFLAKRLIGPRFASHWHKKRRKSSHNK